VRRVDRKYGRYRRPEMRAISSTGNTAGLSTGNTADIVDREYGRFDDREYGRFVDREYGRYRRPEIRGGCRPGIRAIRRPGIRPTTSTGHTRDSAVRRMVELPVGCTGRWVSASEGRKVGPLPGQWRGPNYTTIGESDVAVERSYHYSGSPLDGVTRSSGYAESVLVGRFH